jgi:hypothetical protein
MRVAIIATGSAGLITGAGLGSPGQYTGIVS